MIIDEVDPLLLDNDNSGCAVNNDKYAGDTTEADVRTDLVCIQF